MFGTLGGPELLLILVIALIVFGPRKLPEIGKSMGKMMAEFRKASSDFQRTIEEEVESEKVRPAAVAPPLALPAPQDPPPPLTPAEPPPGAVAQGPESAAAQQPEAVSPSPAPLPPR
jgi:TatA/E family protein of Tat protein translocase